jgi:hypothetical protein
MTIMFALLSVPLFAQATQVQQVSCTINDWAGSKVTVFLEDTTGVYTMVITGVPNNSGTWTVNKSGGGNNTYYSGNGTPYLMIDQSFGEGLETLDGYFHYGVCN